MKISKKLLLLSAGIGLVGCNYQEPIGIKVKKHAVSKSQDKPVIEEERSLSDFVSKPYSTGFVFVDGKYIDVPYRLKVTNAKDIKV